MPKGDLVTATMPPASLDGTTLTIRNGYAPVSSLGQLVERNVLSASMAALLKEYLKQNLNMVISGFSGSGRATLLGVLGAHLDPSQRIISVESNVKLRMQHAHWVRLEAGLPVDGRSLVSLRDRFITAQSMCPDRIVIGECDGLIQDDFLQYLNNGSSGNIAVVTARSPEDSLRRFTIAALKGGLPERFVPNLLADNIHVIVQTKRLFDGSFKVSEIAEVVGCDNGQVALSILYQLDSSGFVNTGNSSRFV